MFWNHPIEAMKRLKVERLGHRLHRSARRALGLDRTVYVEQRLGEYRGYWEAAAARLGAQFHTITDGIWEISRNGASVRLAGHVAPADDPVTLRLAGDKELGYRMAESVGVPVPAHVVVTLSDLATARTFLAERGGPLVVKPQRGTSSGVGITTHIGTWRTLRRAIILASLFDDRIIVEQMVPAESCRLLFLDGELLHAVRRRGVAVTGDSVGSLEALMAAGGHVMDDTARVTLAAQGRGLSYVPETGERVVVRCLPARVAERSELRTIYDETITPIVADALVAEAARVVAALGARFAGVDVLTNDPGRALAAAGGVFLEINTTPGIHHHYQTDLERKTHPVAVAVLKRLLADGHAGGASWRPGRADPMELSGA